MRRNDDLFKPDGRKAVNPFENGSRASFIPEYLTTRATLFLAFASVAVCLSVPSEASFELEKFFTAFLAVLIYILVWAFTLRYIENPDIWPVCLSLNLIPALALFVALKGSLSPFGAVFAASSVSSLCLLPPDDDLNSGKEAFADVDFMNGDIVRINEFKRADLKKEILIPLLLSMSSSFAGTFVCIILRDLTGASGKGIRLFVSSVFMMLLSRCLSFFKSHPLVMSSKKMSDSYLLPSTGPRHMRSFLLRRLRFVISMTIIASGCVLSDFINARFDLGFVYMKYIVCILIVFALSFAHGSQSAHLAQYQAELCAIVAVSLQNITSLSAPMDIIRLLIPAAGADILITGLLYTHNRRLIKSHRSIFVSGMPLELMSVSFIVMACEIILEDFQIMM